jgi:hypothetical protein
MGQIVQYNNMASYKREKTLKWIDKVGKNNDQKQQLTTLIPAKVSIAFNA